MRSFTYEDPNNPSYSVVHNFFGDTQGHTVVQVTPPSTYYRNNFRGTSTGIDTVRPGSRRLFEERHDPPKVDYLTSTAPHQVASAIAAAAVHSKSRWGEYPKPSDNLSKFSLPLVQHFANLGLVKSNDVATEVGNGLNLSTSRAREQEARYALSQFDRMSGNSHPVLGTEDKSNALYNRGRSMIRSAIRQRRTSRRGNPQQFVQEELPGVNWSQF